MAVKGKLFFLFLVITLVALEGVLTCGKCCKDKMCEKIKAIKKLNEVQNVLLHDLSTMIGTCDEGGQGSGSNQSSSGGSEELSANGLENSVIVGKNATHLANLTNWLQPVAQSEHRWELCWRASRDGWAASTFHSLCDEKGPTVTIIQVAAKYIFGGYISVSWSSRTGYVSYSNAFLFSLVNNMNIAATKLPVYRYTGYAVYNNPGYGPTFGGGHDLYIANDASANTNSYTNLGYTYIPPNGATYATTAAKTFLAGSYKFQPDEIETFYETK